MTAETLLLATLPTALGQVELWQVDGAFATRREYTRADTGEEAISVIPMDALSARLIYADCRRRGSLRAAWPASPAHQKEGPA
jgi:hypothetical protein